MGAAFEVSRVKWLGHLPTLHLIYLITRAASQSATILRIPFQLG